MLTKLSTYIEKTCSYNSEVGVLITGRQRELMSDSNKLLTMAVDQVDLGVGLDVVASTLRGFVLSIKEVVGEVPDKEVLQNIFTNFCIGK